MTGRTTFPRDFLWGVSVGAHQTEGNNTASDWWARENQPGSPVAEPAGDAVDSYHRWREDFDLAANAGFTDYRFGIEWSRIEPADGRISRAEIAHYRRMVEGALERGLRPLLTLHHFTNPLWFTLAGGWTRSDAADRFSRYIDALAPVLDAGVNRVQTFNEPNVLASFPALGNGESISNGLPVPDSATTDAVINSHHAARERIKRNHPDIAVGWGVSVQDYQPVPGAETAAIEYARLRDAIFIEAARNDDWIGVQTYTRGRIRPDGTAFIDPSAPRTQTGWEDYPNALGGAVTRVAHMLQDVPIIVTENGIATNDDEHRIAFSAAALRSLEAAMQTGADVRGYFHWSLLDNWEWGHWEPRFGLVSVDRTTFARAPKPSLGWLGEQNPGQQQNSHMGGASS